MPTPESQSIGRCAELRQDCREGIFTKMDEQHGIQMKVLGEIRTTLAYQKGQRNGKKGDGTGVGIPNIVSTWGLPLLFLLILGIIYWLKVGGWL